MRLHLFATSSPAYDLRNVVTCVPKMATYMPAWWCVYLGFLLVFNLANSPFVLCNAAIDAELVQTVPSETVPMCTHESLKDQCEAAQTSQAWSQFLEDYVVGQSSSVSSRTSKDLPLMSHHDFSSPGGMHMGFNGGPQPNQPLTYHSSAYKRPGGIYITRRIGEAAELEPHMRKPVENPVINPQFRPMTNQMLQQQQQHQQHQQQQRQQPGFLQQLFGFGSGSGSSGIGAGVPQNIQSPPQQQQLRPLLPIQQSQQPQLGQQLTQQQQQQPQPQQQQQQHHSGTQTFRAVSENDLYLLGAIEKLVYRVDYLESRVRRAEQLIYYLMAGNNQKEVKDPCPANFTRISDNCYYINSHQQVNWKTANSACKALNAHLAEFERVSENEEMMAYLLNQPQHRERDYWLGGLNPGLLWIWSNSAKPVNPNMNLTSIAMAQKKQDNATAANLVDSDERIEKTTDGTNDDTVLNNTLEIKGQGRCLRLSYNASKHSYAYYGQECTSRHHYICEAEDKTLDNKIKKIARELNLF